MRIINYFQIEKSITSNVDELRRLCSIKERKCKFNIKIHSGAVKTDERLELFKKTLNLLTKYTSKIWSTCGLN